MTLPNEESTVVFEQDADYEAYLNQSLFTMTVTDGSIVESRLVPFIIEGVSTADIVSNQTGYLVFTYSDGSQIVKKSFTYSVVEPVVEETPSDE